MGQATTTFQLDIKNGATFSTKVEAPPLMIDAFMPLQTKIRNDDSWHTIRLDAGQKDFVKLLIIKSDKYEVEGCPSGGYLYLEFFDGKAERPVNAMRMDGPHIYLGPSLDLLPEELIAIRFKNKLTTEVIIDIVICKTATVPDDNQEVLQRPAPVKAPAES